MKYSTYKFLCIRWSLLKYRSIQNWTKYREWFVMESFPVLNFRFVERNIKIWRRIAPCIFLHYVLHKALYALCFSIPYRFDQQFFRIKQTFSNSLHPSPVLFERTTRFHSVVILFGGVNRVAGQSLSIFQRKRRITLPVECNFCIKLTRDPHGQRSKSESH